MLLLQAAQQAANAVATGAVAVSDPGAAITIESYLHQAYVAAISVYGIQTLKRVSWFPWLNANSEMVTKAVAWGVALVSALAIQVTITGDAAMGWNGTFHVNSSHALWDSVGRVIVSKGMQTGIYEKFFNKPVQVVPVAPEPMNPTTGKPAPQMAVHAEIGE